MLWFIVVSAATESLAKQWATYVQTALPGSSVEYGEFNVLAEDLLSPASVNRQWLAQNRLVILLIPPAAGPADLTRRASTLADLRERLGVSVSLLTFHS